MKTFETVKKHIKFLLSDLSSQNGHHTFEHLCRHFARQRIGLNVLPATGTVAKGGDQGRDFETFRSFLNGQSNGDTTFKIVEVTNKTFAFACTTQKDRLPAKIKSDIKNTVEQGTPIDGVYYFTTQDVNVSDRHKLQKWAYDTHKITLEIFDGEGLAEQLSGKELFWIAEEFLGISSEVFPPIEDVEYEKLKEKWKDKTSTHHNWAEFEELKTAARRTLFDKNVKQDLTFWVDKLDQYSKLEGTSILKRKALYEAVAVHIRGTRKLEGKEHWPEEYFSLGDFNFPVEAEDALVIWSYANTSAKLGTSNFKQEDLSKWRSSIEEYTEAELKKENPVAIKAVLFELKAQLLLHTADPAALDEVFEWWAKLVELIEETPLFPLERFSDILNAMVPFIGEHPKYEELTQKVDALLNKRIGGFRVADNCRERGLVFYKNGLLLKAINEIHRAKIDYFADETLYGSLLSMLLIAEWYLEMGLTYAAKYYGLAVVYMASSARDEKIKTFLPRGLWTVAHAEYSQGDWVVYLETIEFVFKAMGTFSPDIDEKTTKGIFDGAMLHTGNVVGISKALSKEHGDFAQDRVSKMRMNDWFDELLPSAIKSWSEMPKDKLLKKLQDNLHGKPFSDVGTRRKVIWKELGITWEVEWNNTFLETSKAEQFIAVLQILLADLATQDFYLLPVLAKVELEFKPVSKLHIEQFHTNSEYKWHVTLPESIPNGIKEIQDYNMDAFGVASALIAEISLLPNEKVMEKFQDAMKRGVTNKTLIVSSYEVAYRNVVSNEVFDEAAKLPIFLSTEKLDFSEPIHKELQWKADLIPEYNQKESLEHVKTRYDKSIVPLKETLRKLKELANFKSIVKKLREEGWKDWHIVMSLGSIAVNYRVHAAGKNPDMQSKELRDKFVQEVFMKELEKPEDSTSIHVPLSEFNEEAIRLHLYMTMPSTLKGLGLHIKNGRPNKEGLNKFLGSRYNYWSDDIEHDDLFF